MTGHHAGHTPRATAPADPLLDQLAQHVALARASGNPAIDAQAAPGAAFTAGVLARLEGLDATTIGAVLLAAGYYAGEFLKTLPPEAGAAAAAMAMNLLQLSGQQLYTARVPSRAACTATWPGRRARADPDRRPARRRDTHPHRRRPAVNAPYYRDEQVTLLLGDTLDVLRGIPDESVDCIVTSPPYYGLRDYGVEGQYGLEATPAEYAARMAQSPVTLDPFGRPLAYDPLGMLGLPAQQAQRAAQRRADAPAAAPAADAEPQQAGNGPQEPAENCAHCGRPRNGYGSYLGAKVCHTGTNPPDADPIDCYRLVTVYREPIGLRLPSSRKSPSEIAIGDTVWSGGAWFAVARVEQWDNWFQFSNAQGATSTWSADQAVYVREQQPTAPPICPGCEMPETNCCCG